ncbi:hypothetical protein L596_011649 [Steinernema carpocapsae]|uniref:Uncharacterized protein n=1 Tax=Steinernema carpocapsae TaxID=34508 RepID=A0A4U5NUK5_STECR|nr:hypothetical protein L596_011649 [Steinernema carpocapsae]
MRSMIASCTSDRWITFVISAVRTILLVLKAAVNTAKCSFLQCGNSGNRSKVSTSTTVIQAVPNFLKTFFPTTLCCPWRRLPTTEFFRIHMGFNRSRFVVPYTICPLPFTPTIQDDHDTATFTSTIQNERLTIE